MSYICYVYYIIGLIGLLSAQVVASSLNPIHRIAFQIQVFLSGSFLMILLDFYFLGLTYIIVYVGAIMIQFLFVIMMVQIHQIPVSLSVTPRVLSSSHLTSGLTVPTQISIGGNLRSIFLNSQPGVGSNDIHGNSMNSSDLTLSMIMDFGQTNNPALQSNQFDSSMAQGRSNTRSLSLSDSFVKSVRSLVLGLVLIQSLIIFMSSSLINNQMVVNYFLPAWSIEFKTMTDLETLANILYVGYPTALILISIALWVVMIGIIKVTMSEKA